MADTASEERLKLRDFERAAADWWWEIDANLHIIATSEGVTAAVGRPYQLLKGEPLTSLGHLLPAADGEPPLLRASRKASAVRGQFLIMQSELYCLDGMPLLDPSGKLLGFRGLARRVESDRAEDLLQSMSSELRPPLEAIIREADMLAAMNGEPHHADFSDYARDIGTASRHLMTLLPGRAGQQTTFETFDVCGAVQEAVSMVSLRAAEKGLMLEPPPPLGLSVRGDRHRVLQILVNLLTNAVKFTPAGGTIGVETAEHIGHAQIRVWDTGPGIPAGDRDRIFGKFAKLSHAQEEGSGLGLHISRELARGMGGDLQLESAPREGARFVLTLPAA